MIDSILYRMGLLMKLDDETAIESSETEVHLPYWITEGKVMIFIMTGFHATVKQKQGQWA